MEAKRDELTGRWSLSGVEPSEATFERMCKMLREGENFKFARYGDGEFNCMFGKFGHNCDGHEYFSDLGTALNNAFYSDPKYMVGIQPLSVQGGLYQRATTDREGPKNIYDADVLHSVSIDGKLAEFIESFKKRKVVIIGPEHTQSLIIGRYTDHILIQSKNCWKQFDHMVKCIEHYLRWVEDPIFLLCASMTSEVLIDYFRNDDVTMIDCGSVFDPYCGVKSRRYHHKLAL